MPNIFGGGIGQPASGNLQLQVATVGPLSNGALLGVLGPALLLGPPRAGAGMIPVALKCLSTAAGANMTLVVVPTWSDGSTATGLALTPFTAALPFIALALEQKKPELQALFARIGRGVCEDKLEARQALGLMGEAVAGAIKAQIADGVPPKNADSTIDRKGSSTPLIAQGQLRAAVAYDVRERTA